MSRAWSRAYCRSRAGPSGRSFTSVSAKARATVPACCAVRGVAHDDTEALAIAVVFRLPNQMIILVGRDLGEPERFRVVVRNALMAAFGMMGLGALAIWF